jgi:ABC-type uncharacterized transport system fused permease/ATPase subunit
LTNAHSIYSVFTPTTPARLNFVPRKQVNDQLVDALRTPGKQLVIYGETGSGKSTLLSKKLEELYSGHITTRCHASLTFDQLLLDGFDQLDEYYIEGKNTTADRRMSASIVANFSRISCFALLGDAWLGRWPSRHLATLRGSA